MTAAFVSPLVPSGDDECRMLHWLSYDFAAYNAMRTVFKILSNRCSSSSSTASDDGTAYTFIPSRDVSDDDEKLYPPTILPLFSAETDKNKLLENSIVNPFANIRVLPTSAPVTVPLFGTDSVNIPFDNLLQKEFTRDFKYDNPMLVYTPRDGRSRVFRGVILVEYSRSTSLSTIPIVMFVEVMRNSDVVHSASSKDVDVRIFGEWIFTIEPGDEIYMRVKNTLAGLASFDIFITRLELIISVVE